MFTEISDRAVWMDEPICVIFSAVPVVNDSMIDCTFVCMVVSEVSTRVDVCVRDVDIFVPISDHAVVVLLDTSDQH